MKTKKVIWWALYISMVLFGVAKIVKYPNNSILSGAVVAFFGAMILCATAVKDRRARKSFVMIGVPIFFLASFVFNGFGDSWTIVQKKGKNLKIDNYVIFCAVPFSKLKFIQIPEHSNFRIPLELQSSDGKRVFGYAEIDLSIKTKEGALDFYKDSNAVLCSASEKVQEQVNLLVSGMSERAIRISREHKIGIADKNFSISANIQLGMVERGVERYNQEPSSSDGGFFCLNMGFLTPPPKADKPVPACNAAAAAGRPLPIF